MPWLITHKEVLICKWCHKKEEFEVPHSGYWYQELDKLENKLGWRWDEKEQDYVCRACLYLLGN